MISARGPVAVCPLLVIVDTKQASSESDGN